MLNNHTVLHIYTCMVRFNKSLASLVKHWIFLSALVEFLLKSLVNNQVSTMENRTAYLK